MRRIPSFEQLPDYPTFRDIQKALWGVSAVRGAALMVGAGFSRLANPVTANIPPLPLWSDFADRMISELYPTDPSKAPNDPLRLAEEYRAVLGQTSLESLIRESVPDEKWQPGELHQRVVQLPWSDILTTNWDTLLERAASSDPERAYELVATPQDISRTRAPRIVKLHGSLPSNLPFIFTQEDFRTYPDRFAPFVNLAQQVLLENELCLIGFSGNDPNFLQWAGWVRDQLGSSARPIRLVGVLNLTSSQRALLTRQNITPIDLAPLVMDQTGPEKHSVALRLFIDELYAGRPKNPSEWTRSITAASFDASREIDEQLKLLADDRRNYPGWLLTPSIQRRLLRHDTGEVLSLIESKLDVLSPSQRAMASFELSWRCEQACWPMPDWLLDLCEGAMVKPAGLVRSEHFEVSLRVAQASRTKSDWDRFDRAIEAATSLAMSNDEKASVKYQICLRHRDDFALNELEANVAGVAGDDPVWMLRKAALLTSLMRHKDAAHLVRDCAIEIRRRRTLDRKSLWLISREAWAHLNLRQAGFELREEGGRPAGYDVVDEWPHRYAQNGCDPWDEIRDFDDTLQDEIEHRLKRQRRETPRFDAGAFKRHGYGQYFSNGPNLTSWQELQYIAERAGICRFEHYDFIESRIERSAESLGRDTAQDWLAITRSIHKREDGFIEVAFGRTSVARIPFDVVEVLLGRLRNAIDFGRTRIWREERFENGNRQSSGWLENVRLLLEIASRLVVRLPVSEAVATFRWACEIGRSNEISHWWLYEPLNNLLERCLDAVPEKSQCQLALDMMRFPTASHDPDHGMLRYWPNFANRFARLKTISRTEMGWDSAVAENIELVKSTRLEVRTRAILKLLPLFKLGILRQDESAAFGAALWAQRNDEDSLPSTSDVFPFVFIGGPEPSKGMIETAFRKDVIEQLAMGSFTEVRWIGLAQLPIDKCGEEGIFRPSDAEAILVRILELSANGERAHPDNRFGRDGTNDAMGRALANTIMPALRDRLISESSVSTLLALADVSAYPELMQALPELTFQRPDIEAKVVDRIRQTLNLSNKDHSDAAISAAIAWSRAADQTKMPFPIALATEIANLCLARRPRSLYGALYAAVQLANRKQLSGDDEAKLAVTLDLLLVETDYQNVEHNDPLALTLTLVRKECVRLASALARTELRSEAIDAWLRLANDPLPEVRFALTNDDNE